MSVNVDPDPGFAQATGELLNAEKPTPAKAIIAGVTVLASGLIIALADAGITATEWVTVVGGVIIAVAGVYAVSNEPGKFSLR